MGQLMAWAKKRQVTWIILLLALYVHLFVVLVEVEKHHDKALIKGFGDAAWYILVTLTTVGYGDMYPITTTGKIIGAIFLVSSIGMIGFFISVVSSFINDVRERHKMGYGGTSFKNHVIILGWDTFARAVTECLLAAGRQVAIVVNDKDTIDSIYDEFSQKNVFVLYSQYDHIHNLAKVNLNQSALVFLNLPNDTDKLISILNIKQTNPQAKFLVVLEQTQLKDTFYGAGVTYVLSKNDIAAKLVASYIFEPDVAHFNNDLLSHALTNNDYDVQEYKVLESNPYAGKQYGEVFADIKQRFGCLPIGMVKIRQEQRILLKLPPDSTIVETGDYIIFILNGEQSPTIAQFFHVPEGVVPEENIQ